MSATRDKSQKFRFINELLPLVEAKRNPGLSVRILKAGDFHRAPKVKPYQPMEFIQNRLQRKEAVTKPTEVKNPALDSLKTNLETLDQLQARLRFILNELEDISKK